MQQPSDLFDSSTQVVRKSLAELGRSVHSPSSLLNIPNKVFSSSSSTSTTNTHQEQQQSKTINFNWREQKQLLNSRPFYGKCRSVDEFEKLEKIFEGVYKARDFKSNEIVALKRRSEERRVG